MDSYHEFVEEYVHSASSGAWSDVEKRLALVIENNELNENIGKRLSWRVPRGNIQDLVKLVHIVISSQGYSVNQNTVSKFDSSIFIHIWEFLDTLKVSSSPSLSNVLRELLTGRSKGGYVHECTAPIRHSTKSVGSNPIISGRRWRRLPSSMNVDFATINHALIVDRSAVTSTSITQHDTTKTF